MFCSKLSGVSCSAIVPLSITTIDQLLKIIGYSGLEGISVEQIFKELGHNGFYNKFKSLNIDQSFKNYYLNLLTKEQIVSFYEVLEDTKSSNAGTKNINRQIIHAINDLDASEYGVSEFYYKRRKIQFDVADANNTEFLRPQNYHSVYIVACQKYRNYLLKHDTKNENSLESYCVLELIGRTYDRSV